MLKTISIQTKASMIRVLDRYAPQLGASPCFVIEVAYFDMRSPCDPDRQIHIDNAFDICDWLADERGIIAGNLHPVAFVNDFARHERVHTRNCDSNSRNVQEGEGYLMKYAATELQFAGYQCDLLKVFGIRATRNRAAKAIRAALRRNGKLVDCSIEETMDVSGVAKICAVNEAVPIVLAERVVGRGAVPNCSGIMAQHYCDLYHLGIKSMATSTSIVVIDISNSWEATRVINGARAASSLFEWSQALPFIVINGVVQNPVGSSISFHASLVC